MLPTDAQSFVEAVFAADLERLASFQWREEPLHGDPHMGNVRITPDGPYWMDLEAACYGPLEWDLSALPSNLPLPYDRELLAVLRRLRRACVVTWCAVKPEPTIAEREAITHHLQVLRAECVGLP